MSNSNEKQIVILIHGIRTHAQWQADVKNIIESVGRIEIVSIGYGYFDAVRFWCPFFTRNGPIKSVRNQINQIIAEKDQDTKISVIAHSFGTFAITRVLEENPSIKLENLILCGSIVPENYDWAQVKSQIDGQIVNDCGSRDIWPVLAKSLSWGYGAIGTHGAKKFQVKDRQHPFKHSDYFDHNFVSSYWRSLIWEGNFKEVDYEKEELINPIILKLFVFPFKWVLVVLLLLGAHWMFPQVADTSLVTAHQFLRYHPAVRDDMDKVPSHEMLAQVEFQGGFRSKNHIVQVEAGDANLYTKWLSAGRKLSVLFQRHHLDVDCISFNFIPVAGEIDLSTNIRTAYFREQFSEALARKKSVEVPFIYDDERNVLFNGQSQPISYPTCIGSRDAAKTDKTVLAAIKNALASIVPRALAESNETTTEQLVDGLVSSNGLMRHEARKSLAGKGPEVLPIVFRGLAQSPFNYRMQLGTAVIVAAMAGGTADPSSVRAKLRDKNLRDLSRFLVTRDPTLRSNATIAMIRLADPRAVETMVEILATNENTNIRHSAALVLSETYNSFDEPTKKNVVSKVNPLIGQQQAKTAQLLKSMVNSQQETSPTVAPDREGWLYVGANFGSGWEEKHFDWQGDEKSLPKVGDAVTSSGSVNLRVDHINFDENEGWVLPPIVRVVKPGEKFEVVETETVASGFQWIRVRPKQP